MEPIRPASEVKEETIEVIRDNIGMQIDQAVLDRKFTVTVEVNPNVSEMFIKELKDIGYGARFEDNIRKDTIVITWT